MQNRRLGVAVVWLALFCDYLLMTIVIPIFPSLGVSEVEVGLLFSAKAAVQVLFSPVVARVVDGHGLKPLMAGLFVELVSSLGFTASTSYPFWFVMRAIQGLASAAILSSGFLHVQQLHEGDNDALGNAMGTVITGIISGVLLGPPIGGVLFELGDTVPFFFNAGFVALAMVCTLAYDRKRTRAAEPAKEVQDNGNGEEVLTSRLTVMTTNKVGKLLRDKHVLVILFALMFANAAISCLEATCGLFLEEELGLKPSEVGLMYMVTAFPSVCGSKIGGWLGNRFGRWKIIMFGMVIQGAFYALGPKDHLGVVAVSFAGLGCGMGFVDGCAPALLSDVGQLYHDGTGVIFTLQTAAIQVGFIVGPVCGSALMQGFSFQVMSIVLGGLMILFAPVLFINSDIEKLSRQRNQSKHHAVKAKQALAAPEPKEEPVLVVVDAGNTGDVAAVAAPAGNTTEIADVGNSDSLTMTAAPIDVVAI